MTIETIDRPVTDPSTVVETEELAKPAEGEDLEESARTEKETPEGTVTTPEEAIESEEDKRVRLRTDALRAEDKAREAEEAQKQAEQKRRRDADEDQRRKAREALKTFRDKTDALFVGAKNEDGDPLIPEALRTQHRQLADELGLGLRDGIKLEITEEANAERDTAWTDLLLASLAAPERKAISELIEKPDATLDELAKAIGDLTKPTAFVQEARADIEAHLPEAARAAFKKDADSQRTVKGLMEAVYKHAHRQGRKEEKDTPDGERPANEGQAAIGSRLYSQMTYEQRQALSSDEKDAAVAREITARTAR